MRSRAAIERAAKGKVRLELHGHTTPDRLILEGGQGFLPTHDMPQVMKRIETAVHRGAANYLVQSWPASGTHAENFRVTFDKLHNAAFAGKADSSDVLTRSPRPSRPASWRDEPIRGWDVSCDSRIFACEYPEMPVLTSGPGDLVHAHADNEQVEIEEVVQFAEFLAYYILRQTGTITSVAVTREDRAV